MELILSDVLRLILAGTITWLIILFLHQFTYWEIRKVLHLKALPFIGLNAPVYFRKTAFYDHIKQIYNKFPKSRYYGGFDFNTPVIILRDPELIREVCIKSQEKFLDRKSFVNVDMDPILGKNLFSLKGEKWKIMRSTLSPTFKSSNMKLMFKLVAECSREFVENLSKSESKDVDLKDAVWRYAADVIASSAFGIKTNSMLERDNKFYEMAKDLVEFGSLTKLLKFVCFRLLPSLMKLFGVKFLSANTDTYFHDLITDAVKTREEQKIIRPDIIHVMSSAEDSERVKKFTSEDIVGQAFIFFLAGFDTASSLMITLIYELSMNPEIQEKLRNEIDECVNEEKNVNNEFSYELLKNLNYLDMVVNECLRKYPPTPFIERVCTESMIFPAATVGGSEFIIEIGTNVIIPIYGLQNDRKYFKNPEKFDPERFSDDNRSKFYPYTFAPFGVGPRQCIGKRFAIMEAKILIVHILQKYVIVKSDRASDPIIFDKKCFSIMPEAGFWAKFKIRKKFE